MIQVHVAHEGLGLAAVALSTWLRVGDQSGKVTAVMLDGTDHLAVTLDPGCPRCGHYDPLDISRTLDGDHLKAVHGPLTVNRVAVDGRGDTITYRASEPYILVWCSKYQETMAELRPEFEHDGRRVDTTDPARSPSEA